MRQIRNQQVIVFVFIYCLILIGGVWAAAQAITRVVADIQLGMTVQEVGKVFNMEEKEDVLVTLMRKYGFGDSENQARINKNLGKQVFAVNGKLPENVTSMDVLFRNGILYQIALHYGKDYVQKVDWDLFTEPAINKYGQPTVISNLKNMASFSYQWTDEQTTLEISKSGVLSDDKNRFTTSIYNVFYTDIKAYNAMKKDEKSETEKSTAVPKF